MVSGAYFTHFTNFTQFSPKIPKILHFTENMLFSRNFMKIADFHDFSENELLLLFLPF